jgi:hypothetical protein
MKSARQLSRAQCEVRSNSGSRLGSVWVCCKQFLYWAVRISSPFSEVTSGANSGNRLRPPLTAPPSEKATARED